MVITLLPPPLTTPPLLIPLLPIFPAPLVTCACGDPLIETLVGKVTTIV
jgi:hypothetical protein